MAKKGGAGATKHKVKKGAPKAKKSGQFKALAKTETRQVVVVETEKKNGNVQHKVKAKKKPFRVPDEFRNFDERMAATRIKKQQAKAAPAPSNSVVAAPSFVMAAPTFQFNVSAPVQEAPREVEGFQGFLSAMQEPATAPQPAAPREVRKQRVEMPRNVFAVLDDEEDAPQPPVQTVPPPSFMQPATFSFNTGFNAAPAGASGLTSLQRSIMGHSGAAPSPFARGSVVAARDIDPDL